MSQGNKYLYKMKFQSNPPNVAYSLYHTFTVGGNAFNWDEYLAKRKEPKLIYAAIRWAIGSMKPNERWAIYYHDLDKLTPETKDMPLSDVIWMNEVKLDLNSSVGNIYLPENNQDQRLARIVSDHKLPESEIRPTSCSVCGYHTKELIWYYGGVPVCRGCNLTTPLRKENQNGSLGGVKCP
jgi:hypothetical protein